MKKFFGLFFVAALAASGLFLSCSDESDSMVFIPTLQDSDYTVTADADSIVETINSMPKSGTIKTSGEFYLILIGKVINALKNLSYRKPNILVTLDLSAVTGWTDLSFSSCENLAGIVLPTSVTSISDSAFSGCYRLTSVTIPSSVTSIGDSAFRGCTKLASVTIPSSVTSVGYTAFIDCKNLSVNYTGTLAQWCNIKFASGDIQSYSGIPNVKFCVQGQEIKDLIIPNGVISIGYCAFCGCAGLTSVTIPSGVTSIGSGAFCGCTRLANVMIPNSVTSIDVGAFNGCERLANVTIPSGVTKIGRSAFYNTSLQNAIFSDENNWHCTANSDYTGGSTIDSGSLANTTTAANYLRSTYCGNYWYKN